MKTGRPSTLTPTLAATIDWTQTFTAISQGTGASMRTVREYARRAGVTKASGRRKADPPPIRPPKLEVVEEYSLPPSGMPSGKAFSEQQTRLAAAGWIAKGANYLSPDTSREHSHYVALGILKDGA